MKKQTIFGILALIACLCLCACGGETPTGTTAATDPNPTVTAPTQTEGTTAPTEDGKILYRVAVVDQDGNPVSGAMVQLCLDTCLPGATNASGVAEFKVTEADYKVSLMMMPAGYTYATEEQEFHFAAGTTELTITLKAEG
ncbi:MAG: hypothetical protein ACI4PO_05475 [Faecousia sp.]